MPAIVGIATLLLDSAPPGIRPRVSSSAFATMGGMLCAACRSLAAAMASPSEPIGVTPRGRKLAGCRVDERSWWSETALRTDATNRLTLPAAEGRRLDRVRSHIAEVIRGWKNQWGLTGCQARSERAQRHPMVCCLVAFCGLERERPARGRSMYKLQQHRSCQGRTVVLPALERLRQTA